MTSATLLAGDARFLLDHELCQDDTRKLLFTEVSQAPQEHVINILEGCLLPGIHACWHDGRTDHSLYKATESLQHLAFHTQN